MRIFRTLEEVRGEIQNPVVTIGSYDGVHGGHRKILEHVRRLADETNGESVVVTFDPHPRKVLNPDDKSLYLLNSFEEKIYLLDSVGIDHVFVVRFTPEFSRISSYDFAKEYLFGGIGTRTLVIGYNHHFGHNRQGDMGYLESLKSQYDFNLYQIPKYDIDNGKVSSTTIRERIAEGDMATANKYLSEPYFLIGRAADNGRFEYDEPNKLLPPSGIYRVEVSVPASPEMPAVEGTLSVGVDGRLDLTDGQLYSPGSRLLVRFR